METRDNMETFIETSDGSQETANIDTGTESSDSATEGPPEEPHPLVTEKLGDQPHNSATEELPEGSHDLAIEELPERPHNSATEESANEKSPERRLPDGPRVSAGEESPVSASEEVSDLEKQEIPVASCSSCSHSASLSSEAVEVASAWVLDFMVSCLCQYFKEGRMTEFARSRDSTEAFIHGLSRLNQHQRKKVYMCQFLARIAEGKNLDVQFEKDERITPLESALLIWTLLKNLQGGVNALHEEIHLLIQVQACY